VGSNNGQNASGVGNTFIGYTVSDMGVSGDHNTNIRRRSLKLLTGGNYNSAYGAYSGEQITGGVANTVIGYGAGQTVASGSYNTIIGHNAGVYDPNTSNSIVIGVFAKATAGRQIVFGNNNVQSWYDNAYFGKGVSAATVMNFTINATGGDGTDVAGSALILAGGRGTGTANGGDLIFKTTSNGASNSIQNPLVEHLRINTNKIISASGAFYVKAYSAAAATTIDFGLTNAAETSAAPGGTITITQIQDGGSYVLSLTNTMGGNYTFTSSGVGIASTRCSPNTGTANQIATTAGKITLVNFIRIGNKVYCTFVSDF
jgi:hypothetical protein